MSRISLPMILTLEKITHQLWKGIEDSVDALVAIRRCAIQKGCCRRRQLRAIYLSVQGFLGPDSQFGQPQGWREQLVSAT